MTDVSPGGRRRAPSPSRPEVDPFAAQPSSSLRRFVASSLRRFVASSLRRIVASSHRRIVERVAGGVGASIGAVFTVVGRTRGLREDPFSRWR